MAEASGFVFSFAYNFGRQFDFPEMPRADMTYSSH